MFGMAECPGSRAGCKYCEIYDWLELKAMLFPYRSRLGCQICLKKSMEDMTVRVPEAVADARQSVDMSKNS